MSTSLLPQSLQTMNNMLVTTLTEVVNGLGLEPTQTYTQHLQPEEKFAAVVDMPCLEGWENFIANIKIGDSYQIFLRTMIAQVANVNDPQAKAYFQNCLNLCEIRAKMRTSQNSPSDRATLKNEADLVRTEVLKCTCQINFNATHSDHRAMLDYLFNQSPDPLAYGRRSNARDVLASLTTHYAKRVEALEAENAAAHARWSLAAEVRRVFPVASTPAQAHTAPHAAPPGQQPAENTSRGQAGSASKSRT